MANINKPDMTNLWASGGAIIAPSDSKVQQGWTAEIPPHQWENYVQNRQDNAIAYLFQHGIAQWDATTEYQASTSFVQNDGLVWQALTTNTNIPPVEGSDWTRFGLLPTSVTATSTNSVTGNSHTHEVDKASESAQGVIEIATQAETDAGSDDTRAVTPKKLSSGFAISLATNGYIKLPSWLGGLILQWQGVTTSAAEVTTFTFPIAFPNEAYRIYVSLNSPVRTNATCGGASTSLSQGAAFAHAAAAATPLAASVNIFSIGR